MSRTRSLALVVIAVALCIVALILATRPTSPNTVVLNPSPTTFQDAVGTVVALTLTSAALNPLPTNTLTLVSIATDTPFPTVTIPLPTKTSFPTAFNTSTRVPSSATPTLTATVTRSPTNTARPTAECTLQVAQQFLVVWTQIGNTLGCPGQLINTTEFAYQDFQHGRLIWRGFELDYNDVVPTTEGTALVLYGESTGSWQIIQSLKYNVGDPVYSCSELGSPTSPLTPARGFGKLLCAMPEVFERIGSAISAEHGYPTSFVQEFDNGFLIHYHRENNTWQTLVFSYGTATNSGTWQQL